MYNESEKVWFQQPCEARFYVCSVVYYKFNPNALSEMNQNWIVSRRSIDGAMLKILVLCVSWFARKLVFRQTDRWTDRRIRRIHKRLFSYRKIALKIQGASRYHE